MIDVRRSVVSVLVLAASCAASRSARADYEPNKYTDPESGEVLEYNVFVPNGYDPNVDTKYPLLVSLHAANNTNPPNRTLSSDGKGWVATVFATEENQRKYPSFFLIPISQTNQSGWGDAGPNSPISQAQKFEGRLTVLVVKELLARYKIDPERLYVTGPSMGGRGTWDMIRRNPTLFAAAAPVAAPASAADAALYARQNIWAINGENDSTAGDNRSAIEAIRRVGGNPIYTELAGRGHDSWRSAYPDPAFMAWLYAQRRGIPWWHHPPAAPTGVQGATLTGRAVVPPAGFGGTSGFPGDPPAGGTSGDGGNGGAAGGQSSGSGGQPSAGSGGMGGSVTTAGSAGSAVAGGVNVGGVAGMATSGGGTSGSAVGGKSSAAGAIDGTFPDESDASVGCDVVRPKASGFGSSAALAFSGLLAMAGLQRRRLVPRLRSRATEATRRVAVLGEKS